MQNVSSCFPETYANTTIPKFILKDADYKKALPL
jgi:hypothetical protein